VVDFAQRHGIQITSCMTLAYGGVLKDPVLSPGSLAPKSD
jgi:2,5-diketo-D-gluconate reductase B